MRAGNAPFFTACVVKERCFSPFTIKQSTRGGPSLRSPQRATPTRRVSRRHRRVHRSNPSRFTGRLTRRPTDPRGRSNPHRWKKKKVPAALFSINGGSLPRRRPGGEVRVRVLSPTARRSLPEPKSSRVHPTRRDRRTIVSSRLPAAQNDPAPGASRDLAARAMPPSVRSLSLSSLAK